MTEIVIQSDNASYFASQELIPFIYHMNKVPAMPKTTRWIFTEPCTDRGRLDTHFSYINLILKSFVEDGNNVDMEKHIFEALAFRGGVAGTTAVLLDFSNLPSKCKKVQIS